MVLPPPAKGRARAPVPTPISSDRLAFGEVRLEHRDRVLDPFERGQPGGIVETGRAVERNGTGRGRPPFAHVTGTCFAGSQKGRARTVAARGPVLERTSRAVPGSRREPGTHA